MRKAVVVATLIALVLGGSGTAVAEPATGYPAMPASAEGPFPVTKVSDGDTIWVNENGERVKIRMIGLDTPELHDPRKPVQCFAQAASDRAQSVLGGRSVYLETDPYVRGAAASGDDKPDRGGHHAADLRDPGGAEARRRYTRPPGPTRRPDGRVRHRVGHHPLRAGQPCRRRSQP